MISEQQKLYKTDLENAYQKMQEYEYQKPYRIEVLTASYIEHKEVIDAFIADHTDIELDVRDNPADFYTPYEVYKETLSYQLHAYREAVRYLFECVLEDFIKLWNKIIKLWKPKN